jgi:hypothetical protein
MCTPVHAAWSITHTTWHWNACPRPPLGPVLGTPSEHVLSSIPPPPLMDMDTEAPTFERTLLIYHTQMPRPWNPRRASSQIHERQPPSSADGSHGNQAA